MRAVNTYSSYAGQMASFAHGATRLMLGRRLEGCPSQKRHPAIVVADRTHVQSVDVRENGPEAAWLPIRFGSVKRFVSRRVTWQKRVLLLRQLIAMLLKHGF